MGMNSFRIVGCAHTVAISFACDSMMTRSDGAGGGIADSNLSRYLDHIPELWTDI